MIGEVLELRKLLRNQQLCRADLEALRVRKLRAVIRNAYWNVPYYGSLFRSAGLSPEDIRTVEDLKYLPIVRKENLRHSGLQGVVAKGVGLSSCVTYQTSGSTGKPFTVYCTQREARTRRLLEFRALLAMGYGPRDRLAVFGPHRPRRTRLYQHLGLFRSENISIYLPVEEQIGHLQRIRPTVLWTYPTQLRTLLHTLGYRLTQVAHPRALITSAEVFDQVLQERLRADLDLEMFNFYGAMEIGRIAWECPAHEGLHLNADHVILECLNGDQQTGWEKPGVVVLTSLTAFAMPFIRYCLGDICMLIEKKCSCGSSFPLISPPCGREDDIIHLPSGKVLSSLGLQYILRSLDEIEQFRLIQESSKDLVLQLVLRRNPRTELPLYLQSRFAAYLCEPVKVDIQIIDRIREDGLKYRAFVSKLSQISI